jgi:hypothetical protein
MKEKFAVVWLGAVVILFLYIAVSVVVGIVRGALAGEMLASFLLVGLGAVAFGWVTSWAADQVGL